MIFEEKYELIRKLARQFAQQELTDDVLTKVEETAVFPPEILQKMAAAGFFGIKVPKALGGQGGDHLAYVIVMEEIARVSAVASLYVSSPNSLSGGPLLLSGTDAQKEKYLWPVAKGEKMLCFALTEPGAGSDAGSVATIAREDGDAYILNGRKTFITMAPFSDYAIVYAKTDRALGTRGISAFIIHMDWPGVSLGKPEHKMGLIGCATSDIILDNVRVPKENMLGEKNKGFSNAMKTLDVGRMGVAAQAIGVAQGCMDEAIRYVKERKQFGRAIAAFQNTQFTLADMATKLQAAKELVYQAAITRDQGLNSTMAASMAKYYAAEVCNEIAGKALQLHGGYGFTKEYKIERMYRDCRVFTIYEGTSQVQQMVISAQLLK